jgi:toxin ParE1/3/4
VRLPVVIRPEAQADLLEARNWYDQKSSGLGDEFVTAFEQLLLRIEVFPELYGTSYREVRPAKLRRFPYVVYYRALTDHIEVLAVLHGSRDPRVWKYRA